MTKEELHGLAATIRSATESETFDLGGLPSNTISQVIGDAFSQDFDLGGARMIRITLVVGAGKGDRSKYDPAALKLVTTALSAAGYTEDRGASCVVESAGCFKYQHDTGKNLKTVVVFPKMNERAGGDSATASSPTSSSLLPPNSLEYKIAVSTVPLFTNMLKAKFPSWSQKRYLLKLIDDTLLEPLESIDASLMRGGLMSEDERIFYEQCSSVSEKKGLVKDAMSQQVQDEQLTASEVNFLLEQLATRIEEFKSKKESIPDGLQQRQVKLRSIAKNPIAPSPLKHHAALGKLWKQAAPLMYLNESGGKLLSPAETKKRGQLDDILSEIANLEESSRGLLEDDESYEERILTYRRDLQQKYGNLTSKNGNQKKSRAIGSSASSSSSSSNRKTNAWNTTTKFQTPSVGGRGGSAGWMSGKDKKKKKGRLNKGDLFGAMMADSDSDSEEENSVDQNVTSPDQEDTSRVTTNVTSSSGVGNDNGRTNTASKKKNKKKKNKNKSKNKNKNDDDENAIIDAAVAANAEASKEKSKTKDENSMSEAKAEDGKLDSFFFFLYVALTEYIIPTILGIMTWLATTLFGSTKNYKKKKSN